MKTVALVGMAKETRDAARGSRADEIWTLNHSYAYVQLPRIDRYFDMHPWWLDAPKMAGKPEYAGMLVHWQNIQAIDTCPVYMLEKRPEVPNSVAYPIERVCKRLFGERLIVGGAPQSVFRSTYDYMMALAISEGFDVIESYGFEMGSRTEYRYQRPSAALFIGLAIGRGITYKLPAGSSQISGGRYMYEGGSDMIYRQTIEAQLVRRQSELVQHERAVSDAAQALKDARCRNEPFLSDLVLALNDARVLYDQALGAVRELTYLVDNLDLEE